MFLERSTRITLSVAVASMSIVLGLSPAALGQLEPDETLGEERSQIREISPVDFDIEGGARRGNNLFHSFREFNVNEGGSVYFLNPDGIQNILSRVTGSNPSNILGRLGVFGNANLFLINPNGIVFGPNASLDVGGSFVATTADGIQFGEQGFFSATNPETPGLLTVNPSALFFNQLEAQPIVNQSVAVVGTTPLGVELFGLNVPSGRSLVLAGGDVFMDGGINAIEGRVEIGGIAGSGQINLIPVNDGFQLQFPSDTVRSDVFLSGATVNVAGGDRGDIAIHAQDLTITGGSLLRAGYEFGLGTATSQAGDILLDATGTMLIDQSSAVVNAIRLSAIGNAGDVNVNAAALTVNENGYIGNGIDGQGNAGDININVEGRAAFDYSTVFNSVGADAIGNAGNITVNAGSVWLSNGTQIVNSTSGRGSAGSIAVNARDIVSISGISSDGFASGIFSRVEEESAIGNGGDITINAGSVSLTDQARLDTRVYGQGNAGNISVTARDAVSSSDSAIFSTALPGSTNATGNGGNITINGSSVNLTNGTQIDSSSYRQGNGGDITITARNTVVLSGANNRGFPTGIYSPGEDGAVGNSGNITISTRLFSLTNGAQLQSDISGRGNAGNVRITAQDAVLLDNGSIFSDVDSDAIGNGGNIIIDTEAISLINRAQLVTATGGQGNAGNVIISATDRVTFNGAFAFSTVEQTGRGASGNIEITAPILEVLNGGQLAANTNGQGNAGNVIISVADRVLLDGVGSSGFSSGVFTSTGIYATGRGGRVTVTTPNLRLANGAIIDARTANKRPGGNIAIEAEQFTALNGGQVITTAQSSGQAGTITVNADRILLSGTDVTYSDRLEQFGRTVVANQGNRSGLFANTRSNSTGEGGRITVNSNNLTLEDGARISAQSQGSGTAGDIRLNVLEQLQLTDSDIVTNAPRSAGGDITVNNSDSSGLILLRGDSDITTNSQGNGGNITLQGSGIITFDDSDILARSQDARGGNITLAPFFSANPALESEPPFDGNSRVDVNADGSIASGTITTPDTSSIQNSLTDLPENAIDADNLIANSCVVRSQDQSSTFVIAGAEGLPQRPGDAPLPNYATGTVRSAEENSDAPTWQMGDPIVEPQGMYRLQDGRMVLSREC